MAQPIILEGDKLLKLATVIYYRELEVMKMVNFRSGIDEVNHHKDSLNCRKSVASLMDDGAKLVQKFEEDKIRGVIARDIYAYIQRCCNSALQTVPNYTVRSSYLDKISAHVGELIAELEGLPPDDRTRVASVADVVVEYKNSMLGLVKMYRSSASAAFSQNLKDEEITFDQLVTRYKGELGIHVPFSEMDDLEKTRVYDLILQKSGRGGFTVKPPTANGAAVFIFKAGNMVWDVFTSDRPMETGVRDAVSLAADAAGDVIGGLAEAAISTDLLIGIEATELFVSAIGIATGFVAAFIIGAAAGALLDLFFGSGGTQISSTDGHIFYVAELPDGVALARQIIHDKDDAN